MEDQFFLPYGRTLPNKHGGVGRQQHELIGIILFIIMNNYYSDVENELIVIIIFIT